MADENLPASQKIKKKVLTKTERLKKTRDDIAKGILPNLTHKRRAFLSLYLDMDQKDYFFNALATVKRVFNPSTDGAARSMSWEYVEILKPWIEQYLNDLYFTDEYIKSKVVTLMNARETKFFAYQGEVQETREVDALDIQFKAVNLAADIKGMKKNQVQTSPAILSLNFGSTNIQIKG